MTPTAILQQFAASAQEIHDSDKEQRMVFAEQGISLRSTGGFFSFFAKKEVKRAVREENTRTWEVFTRALSDVLGRDKVAEISTRYGLDLERIQAKAKPLLAKHVEIFSVGSSRVFTRDIKRLHADQKLKTLPTEEIIARLDRITPFPVFGEKLDPLHISGTPTTLKTHLFHDPLLMDKEAQALLLNAGEITFKAWQE
ncbi:MAG: hypothetical protein HYZ48_01455, partial [Chlamydiales bacterium]|nr:hypothetical protein [Chlamydiales bacterium]